ncbi:Interferon regulatory factor 2 [Labeo rohita]|uniref:Interferon regulatory factor 2 n=1 Tax=Labeo rohita TaxID=84645 RepID=A0ABQ8M4I6_LABRO|nr:Interferon regulatory factor 2 [Labeo rohita]
MHLGKSYLVDIVNPLFSVPVPQNSDAKQDGGTKRERTSSDVRRLADSGKCAATFFVMNLPSHGSTAVSRENNQRHEVECQRGNATDGGELYAECGGAPGDRVHASLFGQEEKKVKMALPGMSTFISPDKPNFKITTVRDTAPSPLHSTFTGGTNWSLLNTPFPPSPHTPGPSGQPSAHEKRASVIMKTSDVSKSSVKTC